jgi:hypothetical protein
MCTGGEYRDVRQDRHFSAASSFQIGDCATGGRASVECWPPSRNACIEARASHSRRRDIARSSATSVPGRRNPPFELTTPRRPRCGPFCFKLLQVVKFKTIGVSYGLSEKIAWRPSDSGVAARPSAASRSFGTTAHPAFRSESPCTDRPTKRSLIERWSASSVRSDDTFT